MRDRASTSLSLILFTSIVIVVASVVATQFLGLGPEFERPAKPSLDIAQENTSHNQKRVTVTVLNAGDADRIYVVPDNHNNVAIDQDGTGGYISENGTVKRGDKIHVKKLESGDGVRVIAEYDTTDVTVRSYSVQ